MNTDTTLDLTNFTLEQIAQALARKLMAEAAEQNRVRFEENPQEFEGTPPTREADCDAAEIFWFESLTADFDGWVTDAIRAEEDLGDESGHHHTRGGDLG